MPQVGRILVVDDQADARNILAELLQREGYTVETAANGLTALPKLDEFAPDVVITDLQMPGLDGMGLLHKVHAQDPDRGVIVITASGAVDTAVAAISDGAMQRLVSYPWPGNVRELENAIERAVVICQGDQIRSEDLAATLVGPHGRLAQPAAGFPIVPGSTLAEVERFTILQTLEHTGGSRSRAAELLGTSLRKVQYKLQEYQKSSPYPQKLRRGSGD